MRPPQEVSFPTSRFLSNKADDVELLDVLLNDDESSVSSLGLGAPPRELIKSVNLDKLMCDDPPARRAHNTHRVKFLDTHGDSYSRLKIHPKPYGNRGMRLAIDPEGSDNDQLWGPPAEQLSLEEEEIEILDVDMDEMDHVEIINVEDIQPRRTIDVEAEKAAFRDPSTDTSKTDTSTDESQKATLLKKEGAAHETRDKDDTPSTDDESSADGTNELLDRVQDRLLMQGLQEEVTKLKDTIGRKNSEIEILAGQLRRAVATKCDLVLAHTELERHHENNICKKDVESRNLLKANFGLMEGTAEVEKELLNEVVKLKVELDKIRQSHATEMSDWERKHKNVMLEKDFEIAQLHEDIRKISVAVHSNNTSFINF